MIRKQIVRDAKKPRDANCRDAKVPWPTELYLLEMLWYLQICLRATIFCVFKVSTAVSNAEVIYHVYVGNNAYSKVSQLWGRAYFRGMLIFETVLIIENEIK